MDGSAPWRQASLDWRTAGNFALGGAGAGLAFCAAALALVATRHVTLAFVVAPLLACVGVALVWAQVGQPAQAARGFFHPKTAWLSREAVIAPVLLVVALAAAVLPYSLVLLLVVLVSALFVYAQGRILRQADGAPAWRDRRLMPLLLCSGATEGAALLTVLAALTNSDATPAALRLAIVLSALRWPVWTVYRDAVSGGPSGLPAFTHWQVAAVLWAPVVVLGLAAVLPWFSGLVAVLGGAAALAAGWWLKQLILTQAAPAQAYVAPAAPPPAGEGTPA